MNVKIRIIIAVLLVLCICAIANMVKNKKIDLRYALSWLFFCMALLVVDGMPHLLIVCADLLGIASPVNMLFFIAFLISIILIFELTVLVSRLSSKNKILVQEMAMLKKTLEDFIDNNQKD